LTIVCGPPNSGKTTWCRQQANGRDLVWDLDVVAATLNGVYRSNRHRPVEIQKLLAEWRDTMMQYSVSDRMPNNMYIIISDIDRARELAKKYQAHQLVRMRNRIPHCVERPTP